MSKISRKHVEATHQLSRTTAGQFLQFVQHFNKVASVMEKRIESLETTVEVLVEQLERMNITQSPVKESSNATDPNGPK